MEGERAPPIGQPRVDGQWIWTERDRHLYARQRNRHAGFESAVLIGTVECDGRGLAIRRGLSPTLGGGDAYAVVVRFSDDVNRCFDRLGAARATELLDRQLGRLLTEARATESRFRELQLDYDAPESKLERWATTVRLLRARSLRDIPIWITSLPAHISNAEYGALFRGVVTGHILQLFDTGLRCDVDRAAALRASLQSAGLPFRIGFGTFERKGEAFAHTCWHALARSWQRDAGASGFWIFPAGIDYERNLTLVAGAP